MGEVWHALTCRAASGLGLWVGIPYWRDDYTVRMLGIAHLGCPRCGRGATS